MTLLAPELKSEMENTIEKCYHLAKNCEVGKRVGPTIYLHLTTFLSFNQPCQHKLLEHFGKLAGSTDFNVLKLQKDRVSFLEYAHFVENPFPHLVQSWLLKDGQLQPRRYSTSNPPILH
jgi:hypothetical protein